MNLKNKETKQWAIQVLLFIITFFTTTLSGFEWTTGRSPWFEPNFDWFQLKYGLPYSLSFLGILTVHEFGHYFTSRYYKIKATLPFYIPMYFPSFSIGTMGAVIRIKDVIYSRKQFFDIGVAGPLAGYVVAIAVIIYGFTHLPPKEAIFAIHPEYEYFGEDWEDFVYDTDTSFTVKEYQEKLGKTLTNYHENDTIRFYSGVTNFRLGSNLTFWFFEKYIAVKDRIPHPYEMPHNPWLLSGFLALFFTSLNLLPIGQLDGGHVLYGFFPFKIHSKITESFFVLFMFYAGLGVISADKSIPFITFIISVVLYVGFLRWTFAKMKYSNKVLWILSILLFMLQYITTYIFPSIEGYANWLFFGVLIGRFLGVYHPKVFDERPMNMPRKILGILAFVIFITSASPQPLVFDEVGQGEDYGLVEWVNEMVNP